MNNALTRFDELQHAGRVFYVCNGTPDYFIYAVADRGGAMMFAKTIPGARVWTQAEVDAWKAERARLAKAVSDRRSA